MPTEEMKVIRILEREILTKTCELRKRRIKLENNERQGDRGHIAWRRFCKTSKFPETKMVWSGWKNEKPKNVKKKTATATMEGTMKTT